MKTKASLTSTRLRWQWEYERSGAFPSGHGTTERLRFKAA